jgi:hypothetical protein
VTPTDLIKLVLACERCDRELWSVEFTDVWGIEVPEDASDDYSWLRTISGDPWAARKEGSRVVSAFGGEGPRTDRYSPTYWEHDGRVTMRFPCPCGAKPERRLDRLLRAIAADARDAPEERTHRYKI